MTKELKETCDAIVDMLELHNLFKEEFLKMDATLKEMKLRVKEREKGLLLPGDSHMIQVKLKDITDPIYKWVLVKKVKKGFALDDGEGSIIHQQKAYYHQDQIIEL
jgi:hypothetical protein